MRLNRFAFTTALALAALAGCSRQGSPPPSTAPAPIVGVARIPAGTMFTVRMVDPLSTDTAAVGQVFTARLRDPLIAPNGYVVAPAGGAVTGTVINVQHGDHPRLALAFETISTNEGMVAIDTRAESAMNAPFAIGELRTADEGDADVVLRPKESPAMGGGPPAEDAPEPQVNVEHDVEIDLVLTKPIVVQRTR